MIYEKTKQEIKEKLPEYLSLKGIDINKPFNCLNPEHTDKNPSMSYNAKAYNVKCFSCDESYDIFDLIGIDYDLLTFQEQLNKSCEIFNVTVSQKRLTAQEDFNTENEIENEQENKEVEEYINKKKGLISQTNYLLDRGISLATCNKFNIGYDYNCQVKRAVGWQAVIIPTGKYSCVIRNTDINAEGKDRYRKRGKAQIFNSEILTKTDNPIFVVEGEIDALSIEELGFNSIALGSKTYTNKLIELLKATQPKPENLFILAIDNDKAGREATQKLEKAMKELNMNYSSPKEIYKNYKDANEFLLGDKKEFQSILEVESNPYLKNNALNNLQDFINGISTSVDTPFIPTGFKELDKVLDGGLYEGLYCIGAISSLGKTTFTLQIADQIAEQGKDVLIFSLEMSKFELMGKSISRETMKEMILNKKINYNMTKSVREITTGKKYKYYSNEEKELIKASIENYSKYAKHIYISEGVGDIGVNEIRSTIEQHIAHTGNTPFIIIDYLQILAPTNEKGTDKQNTDKAVLELKRISRDFKIPVFIISSFNRENYSADVSMEAFKESGAIEYSSDVLIGLQLKYTVPTGTDQVKKKMETKAAIEEAKKRNPREIELKILKNRNGRTGEKIIYEYYPKTNYFDEKGE